MSREDGPFVIWSPFSATKHLRWDGIITTYPTTPPPMRVPDNASIPLCHTLVLSKQISCAKVVIHPAESLIYLQSFCATHLPQPSPLKILPCSEV